MPLGFPFKLVCPCSLTADYALCNVYVFTSYKLRKTTRTDAFKIFNSENLQGL